MATPRTPRTPGTPRVAGQSSNPSLPKQPAAPASAARPATPVQPSGGSGVLGAGTARTPRTPRSTGITPARSVSAPVTKVAKPTPIAKPVAQPAVSHYTVAKGDTLSAIAKRNGTSVTALVHANPQIKNPSVIHPGESFVIPIPLSHGTLASNVQPIPPGQENFSDYKLASNKQPITHAVPSRLAPIYGPTAGPPKYGDRGAYVASMQDFLANRGFNPGTIDGIWGPKTQAALDAYRGSKGEPDWTTIYTKSVKTPVRTAPTATPISTRPVAPTASPTKLPSGPTGKPPGGLSAEQFRNAQTIADVGRKMGASERDIQIALMTALQESTLNNLHGGDRDSQGLFQQRPSQGWGSPAQVTDPVYAATKFYEALLGLGNRDSMRKTAAAQAVQRSAYPEAYAKHEPLAAALMAALGY